MQNVSSVSILDILNGFKLQYNKFAIFVTKTTKLPKNDVTDPKEQNCNFCITKFRQRYTRSSFTIKKMTSPKNYRLSLLYQKEHTCIRYLKQWGLRSWNTKKTIQIPGHWQRQDIATSCVIFVSLLDPALQCSATTNSFLGKSILQENFFFFGQRPNKGGRGGGVGGG